MNKKITATQSKWFSSNDYLETISGKELFIDTDFLNRIYKDKSVFKNFVEIFNNSLFFIEKLIAFEFLQSLYIPEETLSRLKFIETDYFFPATLHQSQFKEILKNSMIISQIYGNNSKKNNNYKKQKASLVDLFLAGRLFLNPSNKLLITGNKKDFPTTLFDTLDVITIEIEEENRTFTFFLLQPNKDKYDACISKLKKLAE